MSEALRIGVIGAGVMGSGIAQVTATAGFATTCTDVDAGALDRARTAVTSGRYGFERAVERGKVSQETADAALARLSFSSDLDAAATADLVIEAVPERLDLKIQVFRDLDRRASEGTILATNTSGFPVAAIAAATDRAERVVGWHWASPAPVMRFAEIVRTHATSDDTIATVSDVATKCGKNPVVVKDHDTAWGFVANRVYFAMINEAKRVVDDGVATAEEVDQLMIDCFGWPTGPFTMVRGATEGWTA
jgi:3-hydroxybutyryl-CoA dehydrogenase/3-hydroxyacyl-CoA dehydrogenase